MLTIPPPKFRRHGRRLIREVSPPPGPALLEVVSVQLITPTTLLWTFTRTIVDAGDPSGCIGGGDIAASIEAVAGNTMTLGYADEMSVGDPWIVDPTEVTTTFDPPGTLPEQVGEIS